MLSSPFYDNCDDVRPQQHASIIIIIIIRYVPPTVKNYLKMFHVTSVEECHDLGTIQEKCLLSTHIITQCALCCKPVNDCV